MNTRLVLALGRMAFGRNVSNQTPIFVVPGSHMTIYRYKNELSNAQDVVTLELQKYCYKSNKRELTIRFAYSEKMDRLVVRKSEVAI